MTKEKLRSLLFGTALSAGLVAAASTSQALEFNFGEVQVFFDNTVSAGASIRTSERNNMFLNEANGGPSESRADILTIPGANLGGDGGQVVTLDTQNGTLGLPPGSFDPNDLGDNYDESINSDDGRLNFDQWDLTSGIFKVTTDIETRWQNWTAFVRTNAYYDAVLRNNSSFDRSGLTGGARSDVASNIKLLDAYLSGDFDIAGLPVNLRAGRQVISWGEGTFLLFGNNINVISPIDVNAFRRPGAEIREGLLPVEALYGSIGLPYDLSLEAFYQLIQREFQLDRPGTPFSLSDVARTGGAVGGNQDFSFLTGGLRAGIRRNCSGTSTVSNIFEAQFVGAGDGTRICGVGSTNPFVDFRTDFPIGQSEAIRNGYQDTARVARLADEFASDTGQWGVALRWYSEELNSTEFGFYFINYHSRLPIASERLAVSTPANTVYNNFVAAGEDGSASSRAAAYNGCNFGAATPTLPGAAFAPDAPTYGLPVAVLADPEKLAVLNGANGNASDPAGLIAAFDPVAEAFYAGLAGNPFAGGIDGIPIAALGGTTITTGSTLHAAVINCALVALQTVPVPGAGFLLQDGAEIIGSSGVTPSIGLFLEYPEDIKLAGFSFNTTLGDWGVQGEVAFRWDQPLQLDTDQITIAALINSCFFDLTFSPNTVGAPGAGFDANNTFDRVGTRCGAGGLSGGTEFTGFVREEVITAQIGTTATYTNSNPLVGLLDADLGILLTEVAGISVPDVPDEGDFSVQQLGNVCTSGTDLPLGGILALDPRGGCRPTSFAWGYVLVGQLQYNSVLGTGWTLTPTVAWSHNVSGNSPGPLSSFREGRKSLNLQLNGTYQNTWRAGISYTNFMGNEKFSANGDQDFVSVTASYSF